MSILLKKRLMLKADWKIDESWSLFLDRDGVINERIFGGYITRPQEFKFLPNVLEAFKIFGKLFENVFVVTNQQGVGKGLMTERNLLEIHAYMCDEIKKSKGKVTKCYYASNLRGATPDFRKPNASMAEWAKEEFTTVEYSKSIMVGDTDSDILFGKNLGMKTVRIKTEEPIGVVADLTVNSLFELAKLLEK